MGIALHLQRVIPVLLASCVLCVGCSDHDKIEGTKQLDAEIAAIKARGEPFDLAYFAEAPLDPAENGAERCHQVWQKLNLTDDDKKIIWVTDTLPLKPEEYAPLDAFLDRFGSYLPDIRRAAGTREVRWNIKKIEKPEDLYSVKDAAPIRFLSTICQNDALRAMRQGDQLRALDDLDAILGFARINRKMPAIIAALIAASIDIHSVDLLQHILPQLNLHDKAIATRTRALLAHLQDETEYTSDYQHQVWAERLICYLCNETVLFHHPDKPASQVGRARMLAFYGKLALASNFVQAHAARPAEAEHPPVLSSDTQYDKNRKPFVPTHPAVTIDLAIKLHFVSLANRRLAVAALALKLYAAEHDGKLPANLSDLVTTGYLASIPTDPMSDSRPISYLPDAPKPMVYSFGNNLQDDRGSMDKLNPSDTFRRIRAKDIVFLLHESL